MLSSVLRGGDRHRQRDGSDTSDSVSNEVFSIPILTITNYQNVNIVLPSELACDGNDVGLGTTGSSLCLRTPNSTRQ